MPPKGGKKKQTVTFDSNLQIDSAPSTLSETLTSPLLSDLLTPVPEAFGHEVTTVDINDLAYTQSTSSSVAQDLPSGVPVDASSGAPRGKAFIPRSILVPPAEIGQLEQEFETGALDEDVASPSMGYSDDNQVPARGGEPSTSLDMSYAAVESTTLYPTDMSMRNPNHGLVSSSSFSGHSVNSQEPLLNSTHPSYDSATSSSNRDWLLNPYRYANSKTFLIMNSHIFAFS